MLLGEANAAPLPRLTHDAVFDDCAQAEQTGPLAGSSAGGEQSKFLALDHDGCPVLVKFTPPRGTPFGERWHDLLSAEVLALQVLAEHGVPVAPAKLVSTAQRSYLVSQRFDRTTATNGLVGRRHAVPLHAVHAAFVQGPQQHWAATAEVLERQGRLPSGSTLQVRALLHFGNLIGNSDMHFGNLSLMADLDAVAAGRKAVFTLAPVYDMLPMRWRPDPASGGLRWTPVSWDACDLQGPSSAVAAEYWARATLLAGTSRGFRELAGHLAHQLANQLARQLAA